MCFLLLLCQTRCKDLFIMLIELAFMLGVALPSTRCWYFASLTYCWGWLFQSLCRASQRAVIQAHWPFAMVGILREEAINEISAAASSRTRNIVTSVFTSTLALLNLLQLALVRSRFGECVCALCIILNNEPLIEAQLLWHWEISPWDSVQNVKQQL